MYGGTFEDSDISVNSEIRALRRVSRDWHLFIGWPLALAQERERKTQRQIDSDQKEAELRYWQTMRGIDIEAQLREMFNDDKAQFRGV